MTYPAKMTDKRAVILILIVWVCSSAISFPAIAWWRATDHSTDNHTLSTSGKPYQRLYLYFSSKPKYLWYAYKLRFFILFWYIDLTCPFTEDMSYLIFSSTVSFYGPLMVMGFTYIKVYKAAAEHTKSLKQGAKTLRSAMGGSNGVVLRMHRGGMKQSTKSR